MPAQVKQLTCQVLAVRSLALVQSFQPLARIGWDTTTLGIDEGLQLQLQSGEGSSSMVLLHEGKAAKGTSISCGHNSLR
eukprot:1093199-Rhodomonas_salina.1